MNAALHGIGCILYCVLHACCMFDFAGITHTMLSEYSSPVGGIFVHQWSGNERRQCAPSSPRTPFFPFTVYKATTNTTGLHNKCWGLGPHTASRLKPRRRRALCVRENSGTCLNERARAQNLLQSLAAPGPCSLRGVWVFDDDPRTHVTLRSISCARAPWVS